MRAVWSGADAVSLSDSELIAVHERYCRMRRMLDADQVVLAAEIARRSRPELGSEGLAKSQGYRNPTALIAATGGTSTGDAARLVKVGEATAPRRLLSGEKAPARHPHVAAALAAALLTERAAGAIIALLDRVAFRAGSEAIDVAGRTLVEQAPGLTMDQLNRVLARAEAWLDPDGVAPREDEKRGLEQFTMREVDGMVELTGRLTPEHAAPVKVAIEALVSDEMRATRDAARDGTADPDAPRRSVVQMQADALVRLCEHALGCAEKTSPCTGRRWWCGSTTMTWSTAPGLRPSTGSPPRSRSPPPGGWPPGVKSSPACSAGPARSWTGAAPGDCSPATSASPSSNATAAAPCAGHHRAIRRCTTSDGGRGTPDPPT